MKRTYSLSFILDKNGNICEDLITFNSLKELDSYIQSRFRNHEEVRREYDSHISEFCLTYMQKIQKENRINSNNRTGSIVILEKGYTDGELRSIIPISVIYKGVHLLSERKAIGKIKEELNNDDKLKRLFNVKKYLLSKNEIDLIRLYFYYRNIEYKNSAIDFFTDRIKSETDEERHYYLRHLTNLCELRKKDKKRVCVTKVNPDSIQESLKLQTENNFVMYEQTTIDELLKKVGR